MKIRDLLQLHEDCVKGITNISPLEQAVVLSLMNDLIHGKNNISAAIQNNEDIYLITKEIDGNPHFLSTDDDKIYFSFSLDEAKAKETLNSDENDITFILTLDEAKRRVVYQKYHSPLKQR